MKSIFRRLLVLLIGITLIANTGVVSAKTSKTIDMEKATIGKNTYYMVKTEKQLRSIGRGTYKMSYNYILDANMIVRTHPDGEFFYFTQH